MAGLGGSAARFDFGRSTPDQVPCFMAIMGILHTEPTASAFSRLLRKDLAGDDYVQLAHLFEEISVLALHHHIAEELVFDAFAIDMYWDELREDVLSNRRTAGNEKFCENFEIAAERARSYRRDFPPKLRWQRRDRPGGPNDPSSGPDFGGGGGGPRRQPDPDPTAAPGSLTRS